MQDSSDTDQLDHKSSPLLSHRNLNWTSRNRKTMMSGNASAPNSPSQQFEFFGEFGKSNLMVKHFVYFKHIAFKYIYCTKLLLNCNGLFASKHCWMISITFPASFRAVSIAPSTHIWLFVDVWYTSMLALWTASTPSLKIVVIDAATSLSCNEFKWI